MHRDGTVCPDLYRAARLPASRLSGADHGDCHRPIWQPRLRSGAQRYKLAGEDNVAGLARIGTFDSGGSADAATHFGPVARA